MLVSTYVENQIQDRKWIKSNNIEKIFLDQFSLISRFKKMFLI